MAAGTLDSCRCHRETERTQRSSDTQANLWHTLLHPLLFTFNLLFNDTDCLDSKAKLTCKWPLCQMVVLTWIRIVRMLVLLQRTDLENRNLVQSDHWVNYFSLIADGSPLVNQDALIASRRFLMNKLVFMCLLRALWNYAVNSQTIQTHTAYSVIAPVLKKMTR